jgi:hypothetical protein
MPKKEIDYSKTVIYKIVCNDFSIKDLYVGSTTDFRKRKSQHKASCIVPENKKYNFKVYEFIRNNGNWENWTMVEIEKYPCKDGNEARSREQYYKVKLNATLNMNNAFGRDPDKLKAKQKRSYLNNKDKVLERVHNYAKTHKQEISERGKLYRENNKEEIKARKSKPCVCEICGKSYTHNHKSRHLKSKFHENFLKAKEQ